MIKDFKQEFTLPKFISTQELNLIKEKLPEFIDTVKKLNLENCLELKKPLQCIWIHPGSKHFGYSNEELEKLSFIPLILVSASDSERDEKTFGWRYIQGAGDDHQSWSKGLTPDLLYKYEKEIMEDSSIIDEIVISNQQSDVHTLFNSSNEISKIGNTNLYIGSFNSKFEDENFIKIYCREGENKDNNYYFDVQDNKKSKRSLETCLPSLLKLSKSLLEKQEKILILCPTGLSESICICMAILISFFDKDNKFTGEPEKVSKDYIKEKFVFISSIIPKASPSRFLMKQLNRHYLNVK